MNEPTDTAKSDHEATDLGLRIFHALKAAPGSAIVDVMNSLAEARDIEALKVAMSTGLFDGETGLWARANLACQVAPMLRGADADTERFVNEWVGRLRMDDPDAIGSSLCLLDNKKALVALELLNANPLAIACHRSGQANHEGLTALGMAFHNENPQLVNGMLAQLSAQDRRPVVLVVSDGIEISCFQQIMKFGPFDPKLKFATGVLEALFENGIPVSWSKEIGRTLHDAIADQAFILFANQERRSVESLMMALATMEDPKQWHDLLLRSRNRSAVDWLAADVPASLATIKNLVRDGVAMDDLQASYRMFGECTLLHKAVEAASMQTIELVLENGADPRAMTTRRNNQGEVLAHQLNAVDLALEQGLQDVAQLLQAWQARQAVLSTTAAARAAAALP